jgi:hypothetical protein
MRKVREAGERLSANDGPQVSVAQPFKNFVPSAHVYYKFYINLLQILRHITARGLDADRRTRICTILPHFFVKFLELLPYF